MRFWQYSLLTIALSFAATFASGGSADAQRSARQAKVRARPRVTAEYVRRRDQWHRPAPRAEVRAWQAQNPRPLVLRPVGADQRFLILPNASGAFDTAACEIAKTALAYRRSGAMHDIHPRTLAIVHRAVLRFDAPWVWIVSGFRETRATSRHNQGRAMDIVLPGVSNDRLAAFLRRQGFVGVGVYPTSGFVHIDVRERSTYWIDHSGPGQRQRPRYVMRELAARMDAEARARGEVPVPDFEPEAESAANEAEADPDEAAEAPSEETDDEPD